MKYPFVPSGTIQLLLAGMGHTPMHLMEDPGFDAGRDSRKFQTSLHTTEEERGLCG